MRGTQSNYFLNYKIIIRMESTILNRLKAIQKNNKENLLFKNKDLYRLLFKRDLFIVAYENIKSNKEVFSEKSQYRMNGQHDLFENPSSDGFSIKTIDNIIAKMRSASYGFQPVKRIYIPKLSSNKRKRPLGIPCFRDKIVQETIRIILESIFEPSFSKNSHGFRPNKSCHSCLKQINNEFKGVKMIIEGDIEGAFDSINHGILMQILMEKIEDQRFLNLIRCFLKAGYMEKNKVIIKPFIGMPQGGILSPLLANVYLDKLDQFIEQMKEKYQLKEPSQSLKLTAEYSTIILEIRRKAKELKNCTNPTTKRKLIKEMKRLHLTQTKTKVHLDSSKPIKIHYVRYADDWIIGINGPVKLASMINKEVKEFLHDHLKLILCKNKTKLTNWRKHGVLFLGFEIRVDTSIKLMKMKHSVTKKNDLKRTTGHVVKFNIPIRNIIKRLYFKDICSPTGVPTSKPGWTVQSDLMIVTAFNSILDGLMAYYSPADNTESLRRINYMIKYACLKTLAHKHKCSPRKIYKKYGIGSGSNRTIQIPILDKNIKPIPKSVKISQKKKYVKLRSTARIRKSDWSLFNQVLKDPIDFHMFLLTKSKLDTNCCICGSQYNIEMHHINHVRKIKNSNGFDKILGIINRKQIPVCRECHINIHTRQV